MAGTKQLELVDKLQMLACFLDRAHMLRASWFRLEMRQQGTVVYEGAPVEETFEYKLWPTLQDLCSLAERTTGLIRFTRTEAGWQIDFPSTTHYELRQSITTLLEELRQSSN